MYDLEIRPEVDKLFEKLSKKNKPLLKIIHKKITEIRKKPKNKYKWLRKPLQNFNRVHIDKHFVLIFKVNHNKKVIEIIKFKHHDDAYKKIIK